MEEMQKMRVCKKKNPESVTLHKAFVWVNYSAYANNEGLMPLTLTTVVQR